MRQKMLLSESVKGVSLVAGSIKACALHLAGRKECKQVRSACSLSPQSSTKWTGLQQLR